MKKRIIPRTKNWVLSAVCPGKTKFPDNIEITGFLITNAVESWAKSFFSPFPIWVELNLYNSPASDDYSTHSTVVIIQVQDQRAWYNFKEIKV